MGRAIRLHLVLRGFVGLESLDVETLSGTARASNWRLLVSAAACWKRWIKWIIASLDINAAFLKGLACQELAEATGEKGRVACVALPP
eukprot:592274-Pyramimonas_sp.AAC.1